MNSLTYVKVNVKSTMLHKTA